MENRRLTRKGFQSPRVGSLGVIHAFLRTFLEGTAALATTRAFLALGGPIDPVAVLAVVEAGTTRTDRLNKAGLEEHKKRRSI